MSETDTNETVVEEKKVGKPKKAKAPAAPKKAEKPAKAPKPVKVAAREVVEDEDLPEFMLSEDDVDSASSCFSMLGDATRLQILVLVNGQRSVNQISAAVGQSQPATSHHIALLRHSKMVKADRDGKSNLYGLTEYGKIAIKIARTFLLAIQKE